MEKYDQVILREIQKNTHMGMEAIDALMPHVKDERLARELAKESMQYGNFYEKAADALEKEQARQYKKLEQKDYMLRSGVWMGLFMDSSTSHMSEMVIQGANRGITDMYKILNHNRKAAEETQKLAKALMDMEEKTIKSLREYL